MVFMGHGLVASFFAMTAAVASVALWRARVRIVTSAPAGTVATYLSVVLVLCKSAAAIVYGMTLLPLVAWTRPRFQMSVAALLVSIALLYPTLRLFDVFPTDTLVEISRGIDDQRARSLRYRFDQEKLLLERASERFLFGWGRFGRNRIVVEGLAWHWRRFQRNGWALDYRARAVWNPRICC